MEFTNALDVCVARITDTYRNRDDCGLATCTCDRAVLMGEGVDDPSLLAV
jgi:hypothetical protein